MSMCLAILISALFCRDPSSKRHWLFLGSRKRTVQGRRFCPWAVVKPVEPDTSSCRQFFVAFNEHTNQRVRQADKVLQVASTQLDDTPLVTVDDWQSWNAARRSHFVKSFAANGGFALVKLSRHDSHVVSNMWRLTKQVFDQMNCGSQTAELRLQKLVGDKEADNSNTDNVGYNYVEISHSDESSLQTLQDMVGETDASRVGAQSLGLLTYTGTNFAAMVTAELLSVELEEARVFMDQLVGATNVNQSTSFQRLARYMEPDADKTETENLGSHCDWSIFTIVPVSNVPGLQVFNDASQTWVCPETAARQYASKDSTKTLADPWNGSYVVLMAGKWLELLTQGQVRSTIHRVVSPRSTPRRYSMPFFLRLRLDVLEALECTPFATPNDINASTLVAGQFLRKYTEPRASR